MFLDYTQTFQPGIFNTVADLRENRETERERKRERERERSEKEKQNWPFLHTAVESRFCLSSPPTESLHLFHFDPSINHQQLC